MGEGGGNANNSASAGSSSAPPPEMTPDECASLWKLGFEPTLSQEANLSNKAHMVKPCMGPAGLNKSVVYFSGINITFVTLIAIGLGFLIGMKKKEKDMKSKMPPQNHMYG